MSSARLVLTPNIEDGDGFYDDLLQVHEGLDEAASHALNARLILVLCNHIGNRQIIGEALQVARDTAPQVARDDSPAALK